MASDPLSVVKTTNRSHQYEYIAQLNSDVIDTLALSEGDYSLIRSERDQISTEVHANIQARDDLSVDGNRS